MQVESWVSFGDRNWNHCKTMERIIRKYAMFLYTPYRTILNHWLSWLLQNIRCHTGRIAKHIHDWRGQGLSKCHIFWIWGTFCYWWNQYHHDLWQLRLLKEILHVPVSRFYFIEPQISRSIPNLHIKIQKDYCLLISPQLSEYLFLQPKTVPQW